MYKSLFVLCHPSCPQENTVHSPAGIPPSTNCILQHPVGKPPPLIEDAMVTYIYNAFYALISLLLEQSTNWSGQWCNISTDKLNDFVGLWDVWDLFCSVRSLSLNVAYTGVTLYNRTLSHPHYQKLHPNFENDTGFVLMNTLDLKNRFDVAYDRVLCWYLNKLYAAAMLLNLT